MALIRVKVTETVEVADRVRSFSLASTGLRRLPRFTAGAHIDVHCGEGIIRQYSLCGDPKDRRLYQIAVKRVDRSRGGSDLMHDAVEVGDRLEIGAPRNNFVLDESAGHVVLLAAGIGITPILAMADRLGALRASFELHYFTRGPNHTAFGDRILSAPYAANASIREGLRAEAVGECLRDVLAKPRPGEQVYMCGPAPFMQAAESIALEARERDAVKLERFSTNPALSGLPTYPFTVELARSGTTLTVGAAETILEVLEKNHIDAAFSCEQGVCGTCVTDVLDGEPEHRDSFLSGKQRLALDRMCICVSRAKSETLVLDL